MAGPDFVLSLGGSIQPRFFDGLLRVERYDVAGESFMIKEPATSIELDRIDDLDLFRAYVDRGIRDIISVPCSITDSWHDIAAGAADRGEIDLTLTTHEANLAGLAAGVYFGTGRVALVHMQNSGLPNAADGFISFANTSMFGIPIAVMVTYRGATSEDDSEPHVEIGRRTDALCEAIFGSDATITGDRHGHNMKQSVIRSIQAAQDGAIGVVKVAGGGLRRTVAPTLRLDASHRPVPSRIRERELSRIDTTRELTREDAIFAILSAHPQAAVIFSNGYTSRCARAIADRAGNFYNIGYMGGSLAIGWGLATSRPDREIVVVDGDQNALMSSMKDHMAAGVPRNLHWYVLNNGIGASVGTAQSVPIGAPIENVATVIKTRPDVPGSFEYPRVRAVGSTCAGGSLESLSRRFRRFFE